MTKEMACEPWTQLSPSWGAWPHGNCGSVCLLTGEGSGSWGPRPHSPLPQVQPTPAESPKPNWASLNCALFHLLSSASSFVNYTFKKHPPPPPSWSKPPWFSRWSLAIASCLILCFHSTCSQPPRTLCPACRTPPRRCPTVCFLTSFSVTS